LAVDVEVHLGSDQRLYVVDTARVLPPTAPVGGPHGQVFWNFFRPEFLKHYASSLSADMFSRFGENNSAELDEEGREAHRYLLGVHIPSIAALLELGDGPLVSRLSALSARIKSDGVNARYLGLLRQSLPPNQNLQTLRDYVVPLLNQGSGSDDVPRLQERPPPGPERTRPQSKFCGCG
jgi:hypothetical protein